MKKILIFGAAGFIGHRLALSLSQNYQVVGYDRYIPEFAEDSCWRFLQGNFCSEQGFSSLFQEFKISCIYHCISTTVPHEGTAHVLREAQDNVLPTLRMLEAAADCGVERVVFLSSGGTVYGEGSVTAPHKEEGPLMPVCSYGVQKLTIEKYCQLYRRMRGLSTVIARISNPYGLCTQSGRTQGVIPILLQRLYRGEEITLFGDTVRDYIYIDDVVQALTRLGEYEGGRAVFNIGSGTAVQLSELTARLERIAGRSFAAVRREPVRSCDVMCNVLDCSLAERELGWRPQISLEEGISRTIAQMAQAGQI